MSSAEIEVFIADTRASRGITAADIAQVASFDCTRRPIPLCFGHPKDDSPAAGTIAGFRAQGSRLFAKIGSLTQKAIDGIKSGEWLNRSMAFFSPTDPANPTPGVWAPRHLGLLGGSAPGIPGMAPLKQALAFSADGELRAFGDPSPALVYGAGGSIAIDELQTGRGFLDHANAMATERGITFSAAAEQLDAVWRAAKPASAPRPFSATPITGLQFLAEARELAASEGLTFDAAAERLDAAYR